MLPTLFAALAAFLLAGDAIAMLHSGTGRFMQRDQLQYIDGMNQYEYLRSRPNMGHDPTGLCWSNRQALGWYTNPRNRGQDVSLARTGCVKEVADVFNPHFDKEEARVLDEIRALDYDERCCDGEDIELTGSLGASDSVKARFWIGGVLMGGQYTCSVKCSGGGTIQKYSCKLEFEMNDPFERPLDLNNSDSDLWDRWEFGTPFNVTHTFKRRISGTL